MVNIVLLKNVSKGCKSLMRSERGSIASRKGVAGDRKSEVSETAKVGTDEQKPHTEAGQVG